MENVIEEAIEDFDYSLIRSDIMDKPGKITNQIIRKVIESELVIADLTGDNPNVFYELALRHSVNKPCIQLIQSGNDIPFDVYDVRTIKYDLNESDHEKTISKLTNQIAHFENDNEFESPIYSAADRSVNFDQERINKNISENAVKANFNPENRSKINKDRHYLEKKMAEIENKYNISNVSIKQIVESDSGNGDGFGIWAEVTHKWNNESSDRSAVVNKYNDEFLTPLDNVGKYLNKIGFNVKWIMENPMDPTDSTQELPKRILMGRIHAVPKEIGEPIDPTLPGTSSTSSNF